MSLNKHFLHVNLKSLSISRFRFFAGIFIGFFYALIIYAFLYMVREVLRISSLEEHYDFLILSDAVVSFYNYIYAFFALLLGQSICFSYWLDIPKKFKRKRQFIQKMMLHDQRFLNAYFLSWVSKLAFLFWAFFIDMDKGFYAFSFYTSYRYLFILFIIVLYLQTWQTIRLVFKTRSFKWLFVSFMAISVLSFGLSKINLINYKNINTILKQNDVLYNYTLELPKSDIYSKSYRPHLTVDIYIAQPKDVNEAGPAIFINRQKFNLNEIGIVIKGIQATIYDLEVPYMLYRLHIHKSIKMKYVNALKEELRKINVLKFGYSVVPVNSEYDVRYYTYLTFNVRIPPYDKGFFSFKNAYKGINKFENIINVKQLKSNNFLIDNKTYNISEAQKILKEKINKNLKYIVKYYINNESKFSNYLNFLITLKKSINSLRNDYALKTYSKPFDEMDREKERTIKKIIPFVFIELTPEMLKEVNE